MDQKLEDRYNQILPKTPISSQSTFWSRNQKLIVIITILLALIFVGVRIYLIYFQKEILPQIQNATTTLPKPVDTAQSFDGWTMSSGTNVEFLVTNPSGFQEGYLAASKSYATTLPNATYGLQRGISDPNGKIPPLPDSNYFYLNNPANGTYSVQIIGRQLGKYHLNIVFASGSGINLKSKVASIDGTLAINQIDKYAVTLPQVIIQKVNN